jgi:hypothetical protein
LDLRSAEVSRLRLETMNFAELLRVMNADWRTQLRFLNPIPENAFARNFSRENRVSKVIDLYFRAIAPIDDIGGFEGVEEWQQRTGFSNLPSSRERGSSLWESVADLATVLDLIKESPRDELLTKQGLRSGREWQMVRKLAARVMAEAGYPNDGGVTNLDDLWRRLGGDEC